MFYFLYFIFNINTFWVYNAERNQPFLMNVVIDIHQFDNRSTYFCDSIRNNIINEGNFIRILYSNKFVTFNGIYLYIPLHDAICEKSHNKLICNFQVSNYREMLNKIKMIEDSILSKMNIADKTRLHKIYEQLCTGNIKLFGENYLKSTSSFILKISGVWETKYQYGLTYKFLPITES